jgi:hypothetical protein
MADVKKRDKPSSGWLQRAYKADKKRQRPHNQAQLLEALDIAMGELLPKLPKARRGLSFALYAAFLAVAFHGPEHIPKELAVRATKWADGRARRNQVLINDRRARDAVKNSKAPKTRAAENNAYELVAKELNIKPSTAERRAYRKH